MCEFDTDVKIENYTTMMEKITFLSKSTYQNTEQKKDVPVIFILGIRGGLEGFYRGHEKFWANMDGS